MRPTTIYILTAMIMLPSAATGEQRGNPEGFNDCILEHVKGDMGRAAVATIRNACARRHAITINGAPLPTYPVGIQPDSLLRQTQRESPQLEGVSDRRLFEAMKQEPQFQYLNEREKRIAITGSPTPFPNDGN